MLLGRVTSLNPPSAIVPAFLIGLMLLGFPVTLIGIVLACCGFVRDTANRWNFVALLLNAFLAAAFVVVFSWVYRHFP